MTLTYPPPLGSIVPEVVQTTFSISRVNNVWPNFEIDVSNLENREGELPVRVALAYSGEEFADIAIGESDVNLGVIRIGGENPSEPTNYLTSLIAVLIALAVIFAIIGVI